jgi:hypothetical protein
MTQVQQVIRSGDFALPCSASEAFPFFSPEGERSWVPGWNPQPLFPDAIAFARDTVFRQGEGDERAIWTIVDVDAQSHRAEYVRVAPDSHTAHIVVKVEPRNSDTSRVIVRYVLTVFGVSSALLDAFSETAFSQRMRNWQQWITAQLHSHV